MLSRDHGQVAHPVCAEHSPVAFDFFRRAERFGVVIRELHGGLAFDGGDLADQADGVKVAAAGGIAAAEIVGQQSSPTGAETNAAAGRPLLTILKIDGGAEVFYVDAGSHRSAKIGVQ